MVSAILGFAGGIVSAVCAEILRTLRSRRMGRIRLNAALQLVDDEIQNAADAAEDVLNGEPYTELPTTAWERCSLLLAGNLPRAEWRAVAKAYDRIQGFNWRFAANVLQTSEPDRRAVCEKIIRDARTARNVLPGRLQNSELENPNALREEV